MMMIARNKVQLEHLKSQIKIFIGKTSAPLVLYVHTFNSGYLINQRDTKI